MAMSKNTGMFLVIVALVLGIFNIVAFVVPFEMSGGFWTGYGFATLAILLTAGIILYAGGKPGMKSKFYGLPLIFMVWPYLIVQIIASLLEMALPGIPFKYELAFNAILLAVVLIGLIGVNAGKEEIERVEAKVKEKVFFIKSLQADVEALIARTQDAGLQKELKALAETIRYSDPMSSPQLAAIENKIEANISVLSDKVASDAETSKDLCAGLQQLFAERNKKCKLLK